MRPSPKSDMHTLDSRIAQAFSGKPQASGRSRLSTRGKLLPMAQEAVGSSVFPLGKTLDPSLTDPVGKYTVWNHSRGAQ